MQLFGFKINNPFKAAEPETRVAGKEIGDSGTENYDGIITEEYNTKLQATDGIEIYDEMRKSDGTVKAAILATSLPIRRANWFIQPATDDEKDKEIADFINTALFESMTITWADLLRQALLMLPFGVMVFEKVFIMGEVNGKQMIMWRKFAPRMPKSINSWKTEDNKDGITQFTTVGGSVSIPMEKLLVFVNEKEGDNWWGTSMLRAAYKHWNYKNKFYKISSVSFERQGLGVPRAIMPDGYTPQDEAAAATILKNIRVHHKAYIIQPPGYDIEFMDMKGNTVRNPEKDIAHHNREIVKSVLAQFLELGAGQSGSRALSTDQTDLFLQSLEAVAKTIADVFNKYAIPQLVDFNFDNVKKYPKLSYNGISRVDVEKLSTAYQRLSQTGALVPAENDEQFFRALMGLPEQDEEEVKEKKKVEKKEKEEKEDIDKDLGLSETRDRFKKKRVIEESDRATIRASIEKKVGRMKTTEQIDCIERTISTISEIKTDRKFYDEVKAILTQRYKELQRLMFQENNDFKSWRKLTFAEKKVNFGGIRDFLDKTEEQFEKEAKEMLTKAKGEYMSQLKDAVEKKDVTKVKALKVHITSDYKKTLKESMKKSFEYGRNNAAREMGVAAPPNPKEAMKQIELIADTIATRHAEEMEYEAKKELINQLEQKKPLSQTMKAIDVAVAKKIERVIRDTKGIAMAGQLNNGRSTTFKKHEADIYALQRSEILDSRTCNFCLSMDGRIIKKTDPLANRGIFHSRCRGIWVEILKEEEDKPAISGVPESIRKNIGDAMNSLVQPKKPIVKKDSLASKAIARRKTSENIKIPRVDKFGKWH